MNQVFHPDANRHNHWGSFWTVHQPIRHKINNSRPLVDLGQLECSPYRRRGPNRSSNFVELVLREHMEIYCYRDPKEFDWDDFQFQNPIYNTQLLTSFITGMNRGYSATRFPLLRPVVCNSSCQWVSLSDLTELLGLNPTTCHKRARTWQLLVLEAEVFRV